MRDRIHPIDAQVTRYVRRQPGGSRRGIPGPLPAPKAAPQRQIAPVVAQKRYLAARAKGPAMSYRATDTRGGGKYGVGELAHALDTGAGYALGVRPSRVPGNVARSAESLVPGTAEWKHNHPKHAPTFAKARSNISAGFAVPGVSELGARLLPSVVRTSGSLFKSGRPDWPYLLGAHAVAAGGGAAGLNYLGAFGRIPIRGRQGSPIQFVRPRPPHPTNQRRRTL
jgi:hypothetical protein